MRYFLVDTENISHYNFIDDNNLTSNDKIILMFSDQSKSIRPEDLKRFMSCTSCVEFEDVVTGEKNAMDFQLIAYLSLILCRSNISEDSYYVVSDDNDFKIPVTYLKKKTGANISIIKTIKHSTDNSVIVCSSEDFYKSLGLSTEVINIIKKSKNLNNLHNSLNNKFGAKGREIYLQVKSHFKK